MVAVACSGESDDAGAVNSTSSGGEPTVLVTEDHSSNLVTPASLPEASQNASGVEELVEVLAASGVAVVDAPGGRIVAEPDGLPAALEVTEWQVGALARDAVLGVGLTGAELDELVGEPLPGIPISTVVAGYVATANTPGGSWASGLLGPEIVEEVASTRIPAAVLLLFVAEATRSTPVPADADTGGVSGFVLPSPDRRQDLAPRGVSPAGQSVGQVPVADAGCGLFAGWVTAILEQLFADAAANAIGWMPDWIVAGGASVVKSELVDLMSQHLPSLAAALFTLATVSTVAAVLGSWTVAVSAAPASDRFAVGSESDRTGEFTATVAGSSAWPLYLEECAAQAGIDLPDPTGANTPVTWAVTGFPEYGVEVSRDDEFDAQGVARLEWTTGREESDSGSAHIGAVTAGARPDPALRAALVETASTALQAIFDNLAFVAVGATVVLPELNKMLSATSDLIAPVSTASVDVTYHQCGSGDGITDGTWTGPLDMVATGEITGVDGGTTDVGGGSVTLTVEGGVVTAGDWVLDWTADGTATYGAATAVADGIKVHVSGTASGPATAPTFSGTATVDGSIHVISPIELDIPLDGTSPATATMTWVEVGCSDVTGTFLPSFNETAAGFAVFDGTATWTGSRESP